MSPNIVFVVLGVFPPDECLLADGASGSIVCYNDKKLDHKHDDGLSCETA